MSKDKRQRVNSNKIKGFATNAISDMIETESIALLPIASDISVEEARDWVNDGSKL